jgi:hypothetical protein
VALPYWLVLLDLTRRMPDNAFLHSYPSSGLPLVVHVDSRTPVSIRPNLIWYCAMPLIVSGLLLLVFMETSGVEYLVMGYLFGTLFGHTTLAAAWTAFGPLPLRKRLTLSLIWLLAIPVAMVCNVSYGGGPDEAIVAMAACMVGQFVFLQLPFWGLIQRYRLQLQYCEAAAQKPDPHNIQFGIKELMIFTTIVALVLGVGRLAVTYLPPYLNLRDITPVVIFLAVAAIVMTLPLILAALLPRFAIPAVGVVLILIGLFTAWEMPLLSRFYRGPGLDTQLLVAINGFTSAWILSVVLIVRISGYRFGKLGAGAALA